MNHFASPGRWLALLPVVSLLVAAACGGDDSVPATPSPTIQPTSSPSPTVTAPPVTPSPTIPPPTPISTPFQGTRGPVEKQGTAPVPPGALLVDLRTARHDGFDRVAFEFEVGLP